MDSKIEQIAQFASSVSFGDLPRDVVDKAVDSIVDTVGCALGGFHSPTASIAHRATSHTPHAYQPGVVLAEPSLTPTAAEATFLNTTRIRYLDASDTYPGGHPSDMAGALFAYSAGRSGRDLITGLVTSYEVFNRYCDGAQLREKGWDQGFAIGLGTCAGLGAMLGLPKDVIVNALKLSAVATVPMRATRAGRLSPWKGCATAMASKIAVDCMQLAIEGMEGPEAPIEGRHGLQDLITGPFEVAPFPTTDNADYWIMRTNLKAWPVCYHLQTAVWAALEAREAGPIDQLESVKVRSYWSAWDETAGEKDKWAPQSRETADHSLPYVFIRAMIDGKIDASSFDHAAYTDVAVIEQMAKVTAEVDDALTDKFPEHIEAHYDVSFGDGATKTIKVVNPRGQANNRLTRDDIGAKVRSLASAVLTDAEVDELLTDWWKLADVDDVSALLTRWAARDA